MSELATTVERETYSLHGSVMDKVLSLDLAELKRRRDYWQRRCYWGTNERAATVAAGRLEGYDLAIYQVEEAGLVGIHLYMALSSLCKHAEQCAARDATRPGWENVAATWRATAGVLRRLRRALNPRCTKT